MGVLENYLNEVWYGDRSGIWLRPLSALYASAVAARRAMYERGWRDVYRAACPVLVVGNRTVGGTGKTPLVIDIVSRLKARGATPGVISRGYGGTVGPDAAKLVGSASSASEVGDEPLLIARRTDAPVGVCPDRSRACDLVIEQGANVIVSDDGLQHLALARDAAINVFDAARGVGNGRCLPAGPLRTPADQWEAVDLDLSHGRDFSLVPSGVRELADGTVTSMSDWRGRRVHAVAGIGRPQRFFTMLRQLGLDPVEHPRADHASLTADSLAFDEPLPVLMTEKDAVKLDAPPDGTYEVPVDAEFLPAASRHLDALLDVLMDNS